MGGFFDTPRRSMPMQLLRRCAKGRRNVCWNLRALTVSPGNARVFSATYRSPSVMDALVLGPWVALEEWLWLGAAIGIRIVSVIVLGLGAQELGVRHSGC